MTLWTLIKAIQVSLQGADFALIEKPVNNEALIKARAYEKMMTAEVYFRSALKMD